MSETLPATPERKAASTARRVAMSYHYCYCCHASSSAWAIVCYCVVLVVVVVDGMNPFATTNRPDHD